MVGALAGVAAHRQRDHPDEGGDHQHGVPHPAHREPQRDGHHGRHDRDDDPPAGHFRCAERTSDAAAADQPDDRDPGGVGGLDQNHRQRSHQPERRQTFGQQVHPERRGIEHAAIVGLGGGDDEDQRTQADRAGQGGGEVADHLGDAGDHARVGVAGGDEAALTGDGGVGDQGGDHGQVAAEYPPTRRPGACLGRLHRRKSTTGRRSRVAVVGTFWCDGSTNAQARTKGGTDR